MRIWLLLGFCFAAVFGKNQKSETKKPHILFIVVDDLGSHDLGMHETGIHTPNSDGLALDGVYLDNYYVLPCCSPTRSAIMSGKYPLHTGIHSYIIPRSTNGLPLKEETLAQVLKKAGYRNHAVGKWHLGYSKWEFTPTFRGFDSFYGFYNGAEEYFSHYRDDAYDMRLDQQPFCGDGCSRFVDERGNYSTHVFTREAINRIHEHKENSDEPLFLYLAFQAVHIPVEVPSSYEEPYLNKDGWTEARKKYAAMLSAADEGIGNVTQALKDADMWNDTLVIFTTDNGGPTEICGIQGSSNYPRRGGKCTTWEGGTTGDGFLSGPYLSQVVDSEILGKRVTDLFHCVDWLPTLAELVGVETRDDLDGVSQLEFLVGNVTRGPRKELFVGYTPEMKAPAIRAGKWKLIEGGSGGPSNLKDECETNTTIYALFNLEEDPSEMHNVVQEFPDVVAELATKLDAYKATLVPMPPDDPSCPFKPSSDAKFGPTWMPWCKKVVFYDRSS